MTKKLNRGYLYGLISALGFSAYVVTNRWIYVTYHVQPLKLTITFLSAASFFGLLSLLFNKDARKEPLFTKQALPLVVNGLISGIAIGLIVVGQSFTSAVSTSFLSTGAVITTALLSKWLLHKYYSRVQWLWLVILFAGIYVSVVGFHRLGMSAGDVFTLAAITLLGFTNVFTRLIMKNFSSRTVADVRMISGSLVFLVIGLIVYGSSLFVTNAGPWPVVSGFFYWLGIAAFIKAIKLIGPNMAILLTTTHPIWTSIGAIVILSEPLGVGELLGVALILLSVYKVSAVSENNA